MDWMLDPPEEQQLEWGEHSPDCLCAKCDPEDLDYPDFYLYEAADNASSAWQNH